MFVQAFTISENYMLLLIVVFFFFQKVGMLLAIQAKEFCSFVNIYVDKLS